MKNILIIILVLAGVVAIQGHRGGGGGGGGWGHSGHGGWSHHGGWSGSSEENHGGWRPSTSTTRAPAQPCQDVNRTREALNKKLAKEFVEEVLAKKNLTPLDRLVCRDEYIQHNPGVLDGLQAVKDGFAGLPEYIDKVQENLKIRLLSAEGDLVYIGYESHDLTDGKPVGTMDVFRFCDKPNQGRCICEHWDVIQKVPDNAINPHPIFTNQ